ncbi:MAG: ATP-binding protein [Bacteriovoracia bacterium]
MEDTLKEVTEALAVGLQVERASVWFYNHNQTSIICEDLFESEKRAHSKGIELFKKDFPAYFNYLTEERTLPANDARLDPATKEFTDSYLAPLDIHSMLDAPIRLNGKMVGVICNEKTKVQRNWSYADETFVGNVCDIISRALLAKERMEALRKLEVLNQNLEALIEQRTAELDEQRARTAYTAKMALLGEMASGIAHEINNPLAIIMACSRHIRIRNEKGTIDSKTLKGILDDVDTTTLRIEKIIRGLRFFARDSQEDQMVESSLTDIIDYTLSLCKERLKRESCDLKVEVPENIFLVCQPVSLSHAFLNLISNSLDAISNDKDKWITIKTKTIKDSVIIEVTDSGNGIPEELHEKIMVPFFTTKPIGKGTGLGLAIVKGILEQHQGKLEINTKEKNTCFVLTLPRAA